MLGDVKIKGDVCVDGDVFVKGSIYVEVGGWLPGPPRVDDPGASRGTSRATGNIYAVLQQPCEISA